MQLENIEIKNYRTIEHLEFNPGKINVVVGPNGKGKSSMLEAISSLLTGKAGDSPVKTGATEAVVSGKVMGVDLLRRFGTKNSVKMDGKTTTQKSVQQWVEGSTGITLDSLRIATTSGILAAMNGRQLAGYLISNNLFPAEIDMDTIKLLGTISKEAESELVHFLPPAPTRFPMDELQHAYEHFNASRPILKREIQEKTVQANYSGPVSSYTLDGIDAELAKIAANKSEIDAYEKLLHAYNDAIANAEAHKRQLADVEAMIKASSTVAVDPKEKEFLESKVRKLNDTLTELAREIQTIEANLAMFNRTLENLGKPVCPISNKLVCTTDKTAIKDELNELITRNEDLLQKAKDKFSESTTKLSKVNASIYDYDCRAKAAQELEALYSRRATLIAMKPIIPSKPKKPTEIADVTERIAFLKNERNAIFATQAAERSTKELTTLKKQLEVCEELIALLKPQGGIREKIIEAAFEPLIDHCNERAKVLRPDFTISLQADEGINIFCKPNATTESLPLNRVSSGEQVLVMLLIMDAINALSGLGILIMDDLDKLDCQALNALLTLLSDPSVTAPYDHIFMAMVNHEDSLTVLDKHKSIVDNLIAL